MALAACDNAEPGPARYADTGIALRDVPPAFRGPLAAMSAIGRGGMTASMDICDDFVLRHDGVPVEGEGLTAFRRDVNRRLGERAGVATDISAIDRNRATVTILSRAIGGDEAMLETDWALRLYDNDRLNCVAGVNLRQTA
jgi:hypothetical protein|tara:strand:- start:33123 stop:33545 length:423 start_codon:yes stop_codon:yes gene_type:complete